MAGRYLLPEYNFFQTNFKEKNKVWDRGTGKPVLTNQIAFRTTQAACSNQKPWMTIVFWRAAQPVCTNGKP